MPHKTSWSDEAWEKFLKKHWDGKGNIDSLEYTKAELEPILAPYTKSGQGEIRIFHSGSTKREALKKRGLIKIPISRSTWKIVRRPVAVEFKVPKEDGVFKPAHPLTEGMKAGIEETMSTTSNPGETTLLAIANHIGLIADFYNLKERGVLFTGGRQKAGVHLVVGATEIDMSKAQIEIDGGFEWPNTVVIVEMKSSFRQHDFDINQALIPMLKWQKLLKNKKVYSLVLLAQTNVKGIEYWAYDLVHKKGGFEMTISRSKKYLVNV